MDYPVKRRLPKRGSYYSSLCYPYNPSEYDGFKAKLEMLDETTLQEFLIRTTGRKQKTEENLWTMVYGFIRLDPDIIEDTIILPTPKFIAFLKDKLDHRNTVYK